MSPVRPPGVETKLARLANQRGTNAHALARAAIVQFVDFDAWFIREVQKGLEQIEQGQVLTHESVGARLEKHLRPQCNFVRRKKPQPASN